MTDAWAAETSPAANTTAMDDAPLFAYGTLTFPEILRALIGRVPDSRDAAAAGWRAAALRGRRYPGLVPGPSLARGRLIGGLNGEERRIIHAFEDGGYELRRLTLTDGGHAAAYVWIRDREVLPTDWDAAAFEARDLAGYVERLTGARAGAGPALREPCERITRRPPGRRPR